VTIQQTTHVASDKIPFQQETASCTVRHQGATNIQVPETLLQTKHDADSMTSL
jgi:hypothetical protein